MRSKFVTLPLVVQAAAYADGDLIGGKLTIPGVFLSNAGEAVKLASVIITSKAALIVNMELILFNEDPAATTFTENAAIAVHADDVAKVVDSILITTRSVLGAATAVALATGRGTIIGAGAGNTGLALYGALVCRGAFTPGAVGDVTLHLGFERNAP